MTDRHTDKLEGGSRQAMDPTIIVTINSTLLPTFEIWTIGITKQLRLVGETV